MSNGQPASSPRSRGGRIFRITVIVLVLLAFVGIPVGRLLLKAPAEAQAAVPTPVVIGSTRVAHAELTVRYTGNLTPEATTTILPKVSGRVTSIAVRENQFVHAGDLIATVEDDVLRLQVGRAQAAYDAADAQYREAQRGARTEELEIARAEVSQAESALETARANVERSKRLYDSQAISRSAYEDATDRFQSAETDVANARRKLGLMEQGASDEQLAIARANADAAERQLELARLQLGYAHVVTPVSGSVARVIAEVGQSVGQESAIAAIVNDRLIYAKISVPERLYGTFREREGTMVARIFPEAYTNDDPFVGTVSTISSVIDASNRTFEVQVAIPNEDGRLRPGMYVNAIFVIETLPTAVEAPDAAVYERGDRRVVFVIDGAVARERDVETEDLPGDWSLVRSGLAGGESIVIEGGAFLADGERVRLVPSP